MKIIGKDRVPFAIEGGGHSINLGFSSTLGVHISMKRLNTVKYYASTNSVNLGAGLIWDDVYQALQPYGVSVVGSRINGVGVAGFLLGGGYSYKSNQFGLGIDNILEYEVRNSSYFEKASHFESKIEE